MPSTPSANFRDKALAMPAYRGRFAPSPTGPLHFGSLISALASYLDAHHNRGKWLVRIEDIDPPREKPGASDAILQALEDHGLWWDETVAYQSQRLGLYESYLAHLTNLGVIYRCTCSRQDLATMKGIYNGHCRVASTNITEPCALRLKLYDLPASMSSVTDNDFLSFEDLIQGVQKQNLRAEAGDQILKRKDGFFAYQLAVVVDDIAQHITHIIRGSDLLTVTARQIFLYRLLNAPVPQFGHVTLATHSDGQKLSKQNHAQPLNPDKAGINLWQAFAFLGQNPPPTLRGAPPCELLSWGKAHWQLTKIRNLAAPVNTTLA